jgi:hypothetical protein
MVNKILPSQKITPYNIKPKESKNDCEEDISMPKDHTVQSNPNFCIGLKR